jgi:hypothetical protein
MTAEQISVLLKTLHDIRMDTLGTEIIVLAIAVVLLTFCAICYVRRM